MFKKMHVLLLILFLPIVFACSENNGGGLNGNSLPSIIPPAVDNGGGNSPGNIDNATDEGNKNESIPPTLGNAPDDQTPDSSVNNDLTNPLNMVGRYKIAGIKFKKGEEILLTEMADERFRGAFAVKPIVSSSVSIDLGVKFQFRPDVAKEYNLFPEIAYLNKKFNKVIDLSGGLDFAKIFKNLGAEVKGETVEFTLKNPDMPIETGYSVVLILNKVSDNPDFKIVNHPSKYWVEEGETLPEAPLEPEDNGTTTPPGPDMPSDGVITPIDMGDFKTLTGHYQITRFITVAAGVTVDSAELPRMQGEVAITGETSVADVISKMQMEADVMGMTENDKYNYTVYEQFKSVGGELTSTTPNPYIYSSAVITKKSDFEIEIKQNLKKNAPFIGETNVQVTVIATKKSDAPKAIIDCGYWSTDTVKQCNQDGSSAMQNIDLSKPETLIGNYKLMNYGMEYQRPAGGQYEKIWAKVRVFDGLLYEGKLLVKKWQGDVSINANSNDAAKPSIDFKTQVEVPYQVQDAFLFGDFKDSRWRFFREIGTTDYKVETTPNKNELKITVKRTFFYKYWWTEYAVDVDTIFIIQKQSDTPLEVTEAKYWETDEETTSVTLPDINNPRTITGHYKFTDMGHEYQRPGGAYEKNWASNGSAISKMEGEMWIKATDSNGNLIDNNLNKAAVNTKYQLDSWIYNGYDDGMLIGTRFDPKFKFYHEEFNDSYLIEMDPKKPSNIKVCRALKLEYKYKSWGKWKTEYPTVYTCFIGEKISDNPQEISDERYW